MNKKELIEKYISGERNFRGANLSGADLHGENLRGANLSGADLHGTNLSGTNLSGANLSGANLRWANLHGANLCGADLKETTLSPANQCDDYSDSTLLSEGFELEGNFVIGYRTAISKHCGSTEYAPGTIHAAPWFSIDESTECHPGLYFATLRWLKDNYPGGPFVRVAAVRGEIVSTGDKWRAKRLLVLPWED